jgi:NTP pyrophosphatase (non-canonical NTP hydrolase)
MNNIFETLTELDTSFLSQGAELSPKEHLDARLSKLTEELGELAEVYGFLFGYQRDTKVMEDPQGHLQDELADVFVAFSMVAIQYGRMFNFDFGEVITTRVNKMRDKHQSKG